MTGSTRQTLPVLIAAPIGADANNTARILADAGIASEICQDLSMAAGKMNEDCGALLLTEEATASPECGLVRDVLANQPPWSDLPIVLIESSRRGRKTGNAALTCLGSPLAAVVLERPLHASTLVTAVRSSLAARLRQHQIRDLLHERDHLLGSLEAQVAERTAKLRQAVEELEGFSYSVSHDLRAPLRVLDGYARALAEDYGSRLDSQAHLYLDRISRAAQRMDRLTQDVLAYSRVSRMTLSLQAVDLDGLLPDVIEQYPTLAPFKASFDIHRPLGTVLGHPPLLVQCFSNLLENAVKFAEPDRTLKVVVRTRRKDDQVRIIVQDNGRGIDGDNLERIFGLFERAAPKETEGTGIGLAIVKKAVERMGGQIRVSSRPGKGTEFRLDLQAAPDGAPPASA
ncbi:MAG TPA: HAMP domain-containing sensor histidine kinase [Opitutaceae bacterium]|nr:HAMP domain-containing sensor histidine kinase [Opitutaceae bacterium]